MIRHIVLFKFKPGVDWADPAALEAERYAHRVGEEVPDLLHWQAGRNTSDRPVAYDYAVIGLLADQDALERYLVDPFHRRAIEKWRAVSDWVVADLLEPAPASDGRRVAAV